MNEIVLRLNLGDKYDEGKQYTRDNPNVTLREFLRVYPARFREPPSEAILDLPMSCFTLGLTPLCERQRGHCFGRSTEPYGGK
jgi:hypothetical protein